MLSTVDSGLTNLIHDRCSCSLFTLSSVALVDWMCPLKREQATRVSYNTLTHSRKVKGKVTIIYIAVIHNRGLLQDRFTIPP